LTVYTITRYYYCPTIKRWTAEVMGEQVAPQREQGGTRVVRRKRIFGGEGEIGI